MALHVRREGDKRHFTRHILLADEYAVLVLLTETVPTDRNIGQDALIVLFESDVRVFETIHEHQPSSEPVADPLALDHFSDDDTLVAFVFTVVSKDGVTVEHRPVDSIYIDLVVVQVDDPSRQHLFSLRNSHFLL